MSTSFSFLALLTGSPQDSYLYLGRLYMAAMHGVMFMMTWYIYKTLVNGSW